MPNKYCSTSHFIFGEKMLHEIEYLVSYTVSIYCENNATVYNTHVLRVHAVQNCCCYNRPRFAYYCGSWHAENSPNLPRK